MRNRLIRLTKESFEHLNQALKDIDGAELLEPPALGSAEPGLLRLYYRRLGSTLEIGEANHALSALLSLLAEFETCISSEGQKLVLLDEPELHLHPKRQAKLAMHLVRRARDRSAQLVFATHSMDICNRLIRLPDASIQIFRAPLTSPNPLQGQQDLRRALAPTHNLNLFADRARKSKPQGGSMQLFELLQSMFEEDELRRFLDLRLGEAGKEVVQSVPKGKPLNDFVYEVMNALQRRELIDKRFFDALASERPNRQEEIRRVQRRIKRGKSTT